MQGKYRTFESYCKNEHYIKQEKNLIDLPLFTKLEEDNHGCPRVHNIS